MEYRPTPHFRLNFLLRSNYCLLEYAPICTRSCPWKHCSNSWFMRTKLQILYVRSISNLCVYMGGFTHFLLNTSQMGFYSWKVLKSFPCIINVTFGDIIQERHKSSLMIIPMQAPWKDRDAWGRGYHKSSHEWLMGKVTQMSLVST